MIKRTIESKQTDAKWESKTVNFPIDLDELINAFGKAGAYNLVIKAFDVMFRQTDGKQIDADTILTSAKAGNRLTVDAMTIDLMSIVGDGYLVVDNTIEFFSAKKAIDKITIYQRLLILAGDNHAKQEIESTS